MARTTLTAAEILLLQEHRLEDDLTYRALAARVGIALSRLYTLLHNPVVTANDRTAFKVRRYLDSVSPARPPRAPRPARAGRERGNAAEVR